ncbi:unannotated protein [freshwater metagenome]|uniref:tRNA (guanine(46)-N(7))-methyltransferase n=1 Tax=freshwater metagenome TaxID=449393 RepID=A0A6J7DGK3_9ZZZZ|nr:tRNA (guanosine(46)-N7)-methyltransferase TrmB [Actinomycetota bacterium]
MTRPPDQWPVGGSYTFGGRQGRMSPTRQRAFDVLVPRYLLTPHDAGSLAATPISDAGLKRLIVEIGCGKGEATAAMAPGEPDALVIACEPNEATIAHLAWLLDAGDVTNVRLWIGDAFDLLAVLEPHTIAEVRIWFPDPWPKPRHAHKRLFTPLRLGLIVDALAVGARLRLATDDLAYAAEALAAIDAEPRLRGAVVPRPGHRPVTTFEARGLRAGHPAVDIVAVREH